MTNQDPQQPWQQWAHLAWRVIMYMINYRGKPWRCEAEDINTVAQFLHDGESERLGNWQHAADSILEIAYQLDNKYRQHNL